MLAGRLSCTLDQIMHSIIVEKYLLYIGGGGDMGGIVPFLK